MEFTSPISRMTACWLSLALTAAAASGATITVSNFAGIRSNPLVHPDGRFLATGRVMVGSFTESNDGQIRQAWEEGDIARLSEGFTQFGNALSVGFNRLPGLYQDSILAALASDDVLSHAPIYTVVTDQPLSANPTQWLIYKHGHTFLPDDAPIEPALLNGAENGTLLVGSFGTHIVTLGEIIAQPAFTLAEVIPEPDAASLVLLAICSWMASRRRTTPPAYRH